MPFDPTTIGEDRCGEGHLDEVPLYDVLHALQTTQVTGRLTVRDERGENHVYFVQGSPVGVQLSLPFCPLGQLLLELRKLDSGVYMRAQKDIVQRQRMPGQVFKEMGVLGDEELAEVLKIQARRRFERFADLRGRPFRFCRGLSFLTGFQRAPVNVHVLLYLSQKGQLTPDFLQRWVQPLLALEVRLPEGAPPLPAGLEDYGFGPPEARFLERLSLAWQSVQDLLETGTLPRAQTALMLYHLDQLGQLQRRQPPPPEPAPPPVAQPPVQPPLTRAPPSPVFAEPSSPPASRAPVPASLTVDEVFATTPSEPQAFLEGATDPSIRRKDIHEVPTQLPHQGAPKPVSVPNAASPSRPPPSGPTPVRVRFPSEDTLKEAPKKKKKKRTRRDVPEPSIGSSAVSRTKKEKTHVGPMPSIVIEGLDDDG